MKCTKFRLAFCSRCKKDISGLMRVRDYGTCGYYEVSHGIWSHYAKPGERYLCDACMWADPRYIEIYGVHEP